jgi:hypothetical protein
VKEIPEGLLSRGLAIKLITNPNKDDNERITQTAVPGSTQLMQLPAGRGI